MTDNCIILTTDEIDLIYSLEDYRNFDYVVCEKGALYASQNVLNVVKVIGDFDSLTDYEKNRILLCYPNIEISPKAKDETDGELAIKWAINKKYKSIYMFVSGKRIDHSLNHLFLLNKYNLHNIYIFDKYNWSFLLKKGDNFINSNSIYVSLFTLSKDILNSENLKYKLKNSIITNKDTKFISNEIKNSHKKTIINSKSGKTICIATVNIED